MPRDDTTLLDIARAARRVLEFKQGLDKTAFLNDPKTQSAVLHQLLILGESVKRLSDEFRDQHPAIPWRLMAGMRDKLIHEYDDVDLDEVWNVAEKDVPHLVQWLEPLLPSKEN